MGFPSIFAIFIVFIAWFAYKRKKSDQQSLETKQSYWDKETAANFTRKKSISSLDYIIIPIKILPFIEINDDTLTKLYSTLTELSTKQIVNLTGVTNTDLKLKYGAPNLTSLIQFDENYTLLVRTLNLYGTRLYELGYKIEATKVLEYATTINTDVSDTYKLLANIYINDGYKSKIDDLIKVAEKINSLSKISIIKHLMELKDSTIF